MGLSGGVLGGFFGLTVRPKVGELGFSCKIRLWEVNCPHRPCGGQLPKMSKGSTKYGQLKAENTSNTIWVPTRFTGFFRGVRPQSARAASNVSPCAMKAVLAKSGTMVYPRRFTLDCVSLFKVHSRITGCRGNTPSSRFGCTFHFAFANLTYMHKGK